MGLIKAIKNFRWGYLVISVILVALGLCVIVFPTESFTTVSYIIAGGTTLAGIIMVVKILADRGRGVRFGVFVFCSVLTLICGLVAFFIPDKVMELYPMFIGLLIIIDGSFKLQTVINAKRYKLKAWWLLLSLAVLAIFGGFLTVRLRVEETELSVFSFILGAGLLICGVQNFFSLFYLGKIVARAKNEIEGKATVSDDVYKDADSYLDSAPDKVKAELLPKSSIKQIDKELDEETKFDVIEISKADFTSADIKK